jgi:hypothetical protein
MSLSDHGETEQLEGLAAELAEAGRIARLATAGRERPDPAFAMRLRAQMTWEQPASQPDIAAASVEDGAVEILMPYGRPRDYQGRPIERRHGYRPHVGPERRAPVRESAWATLAARLRVSPNGTAPTDGDGRRRGRSVDPPGRPSSIPVDETISEQVWDLGVTAALKPSVSWRIPTRLVPSRWIPAGLVAAVIVASVVYGGSSLLSPKFAATAAEADSTTLVRNGASIALSANAVLREGDEIRVAAAGRATLQLGGSWVRMVGGADLELTSLDPNHVSVDQIAGRVYHRVAAPSGGDYRVATSGFTWTASGTAFDLDIQPTASGGEQVQGLALVDALQVRGPQLQADLQEGTSVTVELNADGSLVGSPLVQPINAAVLTDGWLVENAQLDARLGLPLGRLAAAVSSGPPASLTPGLTLGGEGQPTVTATAAPTSVPMSGSTPISTPAPTPTPTPVPTVLPTPEPSPAGPLNLGQLNISRNVDGTYTFVWPKYAGSGFTCYMLAYEDWGKYPTFPTSRYWTCNSSQANTAWTGPVQPGDYAVRVQVLDESSGSPIIPAQTNIVRLTVAVAPTLPPTQDLGSLGYTAKPDGIYFGWTAYTGDSSSEYRLVFETTASGKNPSYPGGSPFWAAPPVGATSWGPLEIPPGDYQVRVQAVGYPNGAYAYAQTTVLHLIVSAPGSSPSASPTS